MYDYRKIFRSYLLSKIKVSPVTAKNYTADVRKFIKWYEGIYGKAFKPFDLTVDAITLFTQKAPTESGRSLERYISSLRKFASFLLEKNYITKNPFDTIKRLQNISIDDPWRLKGFRNFLYESGASKTTIKNYIVDINAFTTWLAANTSYSKMEDLEELTSNILNAYRNRLTVDLSLSPKTVNRKLSSLRRFFEFARKTGLERLPTPSFEGKIQAKTLKQKSLGLSLEDFKKAETWKTSGPPSTSSIPSLKLIQKAALPYFALEEKIATRIADTINKRRLEKKARLQETKDPLVSLRNIPKTEYAPEDLSLANFPLHRKAIHHLRHTRPKWYKRYHSLRISSYIHLSILIIYASILGFVIYSNLLAPETQVQAQVAPPRVLSFQGRLTDKNDSPITSPTQIRFQIYGSNTASGSGFLLWQEVDRVTPDENGIFSLLLGNGAVCSGQPLAVQKTSCAIPNDLFTNNSALYLGITIENTAELTPRQQLASVAYSTNSESLQGMRPITDSSAGRTNVILALDSSGNLTMGGNASPTFSATGGQFKLSGKPLLLTTNAGTNADIVLSPDGAGSIDVRRPLVNTGSTGIIAPGGVEVADRFGVIATESAVPAFVVNNNGGGDIFAAYSNATARFVIENSGDISLQPGISIDTLTTGTVLIGNILASTITIGRTGNGITLPGFAGQNGILYGSNGTGQLAQATTGTSNLCLLSGSSAPSWSSCPGTSASYDVYWNQSSGVLFPNNSTVDFTLGGQSTASAKFAVLNINGSGPVTATISGNLYVLPINGAGGNVGIGTNDPSTRMHIASSADASILRLEDSDGICDHNPEAGGEIVSCVSDIRLKSNITDAAAVLPDLLKFRIRAYTINASNDLATGVIAQEVQEHFPDKVREGPNGFLMVDLPSPWVMVKAIQELASKIEDLSQDALYNIGNTGVIALNQISASLAEFANITADSLIVTSDSVNIAGQSLHDYIAHMLPEILNSQFSTFNSEIVSPLAEIDEIRTNIISPLANGSIEIKGNLNVRGNATVSGNLTTQTIAANSLSINTDATISGSLTASEASISGNLSAGSASISGTLYANRIQANSIEGLDERIASSVSSIQYPVSSSSGNINSMLNTEYSILNTQFLNLQTVSVDFATFREGLISFGPATFGQVTAIEGFSIGTTLIIGSNSINTLGQDLEIQPLKQGDVSFLAGAVRIEIDGTLRIAGNAEIAGDLKVGGKIKTNIISPLPDASLVIEGPDSLLDIRGSLAASGSGTFNKLNLSLAEPAYAISDMEAIAEGSAGVAAIKPYRTELTIYNRNVTKSSLIYITPVGATSNQVLYLLRQEPGASFTVGVDVPTIREIQFNWLIVN